MQRRFRWLTSTTLLALALSGCASGEEAPPPRRGVILFVGDGMGVSVVTAARIHKGFLEGLTQTATATLTVDTAPRGALVRTGSTDKMVTDSAAGITAMVCGRKCANGQLSVAPRADGGVDTLTTLLELAESMGMSTGVVSTTRITHATPGGCYAHTADRGEEAYIAAQAVPGPGNRRLGNGMEVILGGGLAWWLPEVTGKGRRTDGRNLVEEMEPAGYVFVDGAQGLERAVGSGAERILGLFSPSHMAFEVDRETAPGDQPSLAEMTRAAITVLSRNPSGFFLMVEGGKIDHALHDNNAYRAVTDMIAFDDAVREALSLVSTDEVLVVVTSDHDHTMVISGDADADADAFTRGGTDRHGVPFTAIVFGNGPTADGPFPDTLDFSAGPDPDFRERAAIPLDYEEHGAMDVPLFAFGPERYLDRIPGTLDNTGVFDVLRAALEGN